MTELLVSFTDEADNEGDPAGLVGGAKALAGFGVEVLVEEKVVIFPFDVGLRQVRFSAGPFAPGVAKPHRWENVERGIVRTVIGDGDAPEEVVVVSLGNLLNDVEEPVLLENAGVLQFVFALITAPAIVFFPETSVGVVRLRVSIKRLGIRVSGGAVFVVVALFDVFSVVSLVTGEAVEAFL